MNSPVTKLITTLLQDKKENLNIPLKSCNKIFFRTVLLCMANTLYIVRHAQAERANGAQADEFRRLTAAGERTARQLGEFLRSTNSNVNLIISSPAVRALTTAQRMMESLALSPAPIMQLEHTLYSGSWQSILKRLTSLPESFSHVMLVGHYPTLVELHDYLSANRQLGMMQPGELSALSFSGPWCELSEATATHQLTYHPVLA